MNSIVDERLLKDSRSWVARTSPAMTIWLREKGAKVFAGARTAGAALLALVAASCAGVDRLDAAGDVHAFLIAIRNGDAQSFNAYVDRPALKEQLRARIIAQSARQGGALGALAAMAARPLAGMAVDALVQPDVFRAVAEAMGYSPDAPIPNRVAIASVLRRLDDDHVCAPTKAKGPCLLVFRREDGVWRLIDFEGDLAMLRPRFGR